ncbi:MAG: hypothetical protein KAW02_05195 [candidate division Zixibacteria bacterium]|nr:hypothetical protein [candidate division Zixibacteria bacterium]
MKRRRVQAQGIQLRRLVYLGEEEFKFLKLLRFDFLKRGISFSKNRPEPILLLKTGLPKERE